MTNLFALLCYSIALVIWTMNMQQISKIKNVT